MYRAGRSRQREGEDDPEGRGELLWGDQEGIPSREDQTSGGEAQENTALVFKNAGGKSHINNQEILSWINSYVRAP